MTVFMCVPSKLYTMKEHSMFASK